MSFLKRLVFSSFSSKNKQGLKNNIFNWLKKIEENDGLPSDSITAFNFGLFRNSSNGYTMYLIGASNYSEENDDWACVEPPSDSCFYLVLHKRFDAKTWEEILIVVVETLKEMETNQALNSTFLKNAKVITTGFDDGDLIKIRAN